MKSFLLALLTCACWTMPGALSAQQPSPALPRPTASPGTEAAPPAPVASAFTPMYEGYIIRMTIRELPGSSPAVGATVAGTPEKDEARDFPLPTAAGDEQEAPTPQVDAKVLAAPSVVVLPRESATVEISAEQTFTYLESAEDGRYVAKRSEPKRLGLKITIKAEPASDDESVVLCRLECETSTLVGREPVKGLDLDVGKPIVATWSLKTTAATKLGIPSLVFLPSGPNRPCLLTLNVAKLEPPKEDSKEILPNPPARK
jgi:hypothetical protein